MLKSISISNVRNFAGGPWKFDLGELTALCGANSAGKSTLIKSLLLLRANSKGSIDAEKLGRIQFSDEDFDLGDFRSFVSNNNTRKPLCIDLEYVGELSKAAFKTVQKVIPEQDRSNTESSTPYLLKAHFKFVHIEAQRNKRSQSSDHRSPGFGLLDSAIFTVRLFEKDVVRLEVYLGDITKSSFPFSIDEDERVPYHCRLSRKFFEATGGGRIVQPLGKSVDERDLHFTPALSGIFPVALIGLPVSRNEKTGTPPPNKSAAHIPIALPPILRTAIVELRRFLDQIDYTAPLRAHAKRFYLLNQEHSSGGDSSGESIPYLLRDNLERKLSVCLPQSIGTAKSTTLRLALNSWIRYLRNENPKQTTNDEISIDFYRGLIGDIRLQADGKHAFPLADIGFGFSQVLPILVKGLLLGSQGTLIVEQPELHLHPALQIRLAEFFLSLVASGKSVIIESHSEHIVNSLRAIVAEDVTSTLAHKIKIIFISKVGSRPNIIDLTVRENGSIPDFPKEFFGEALSLAGRLLRAQKAKRLNSKNT